MKDMLKGQVALITGGASGMGEATAKLYASEGATVIIGDYNVENAKRVVEEIMTAGGNARFYTQMDVSKKETVDAVVKATIQEFGKIDILAAYAGRTFDNEKMSDEERYQITMNVNMTGTYNTVFAVVPYMKERKSGKIIICSSNGAFNPTVPAYDYHMAKAACESLTVNLAMEVAPLGIRVNCVKPGPIVTPFWDELMAAGDERTQMLNNIAKTEVPLGRTGTAEDIAGIALFFASELSSYVTGLCLYVAGGMGYVYAHGQSFTLQAMAGITPHK
ncbi:SDR family oxidoreductase [Dehalobacter sp. DCM]|uniref:SDR family NAD(P)-dependent oxidoreductase n=1 Tax=Dehalobacter sp. DCM TaxID=2907827 RepID=UPI003081BB61|nr:SDR family oxidoreductase [Dehalobacter sp. DCM]